MSDSVNVARPDGGQRPDKVAAPRTKPFDRDNSDVVVIIGSGAGGGTLANELAQKGIDVVVLEAGPRLSPDDHIDDEWPSFSQLAWLDLRTTSGSFKLATDFPNLPAWICKVVGGTTTHWAGCVPRFKEHEFAARSTYGDVPGAQLLDWPITLADIEPYYDRAEKKMGVAGTNGLPLHKPDNNFKVMAEGARRVGYQHYSTGRYAHNSVPYDGRPASIQDGFCFQGNRSRAKWSTLVAELPKGEATGHLEVRPNCQVLQVQHDARGNVTGVLYADAQGNQHVQRGRLFCVAGNSIESPRLLLNSASSLFPDGLANSSGQVGRNYMRHTTGTLWGVFDRPVHMYRGNTMAGIIEDESINDPSRGFVGGYYFQTIHLGPSFMAAFQNPGGWGREFTALMESYECTAGMWIVGEDMPVATNRVTLGDGKDVHGVAVPNVHFDDHANDEAMREHGYARGSEVYKAVGARQVVRTPPYPSSHNLGTCRMSERPEDGVVNRFGQAHDVRNLFVSDGSQFTTGAAANPTLTIVALAVRQAEYIADQMAKGAL